MGKIFYIMGKSASGKDSIDKELRNRLPRLKTITIYTTRPIRVGETDGVEYYFVDESRLQKLVQENKVIELRTYHTVHGEWHYFTVDDGQFRLAEESYLMIGTLESYEKLKEYFGAAKVVPLYIEVEDGERLARALARERQQKNPKYAELCRRFLADSKDFSEENLQKAGISERFYNENMEDTVKKICHRIQNLDAN